MVPQPHFWRRWTLWTAACLMLLLALAGGLNHGDEEEAYDIASRYAIAGDEEKALEWLNRAVGTEGCNWWMLRNPAFDFMRAGARFKDLLRRIDLPP
ncbi:MAG TPA: hypothetical protein VMT32_02170 [Bryobacteraceae bacterium]|nr:hypothetical protein [Bryobacteraceae bacterium]